MLSGLRKEPSSWAHYTPADITRIVDTLCQTEWAEDIESIAPTEGWVELGVEAHTGYSIFFFDHTFHYVNMQGQSVEQTPTTLAVTYASTAVRLGPHHYWVVIKDKLHELLGELSTCITILPDDHFTGRIARHRHYIYATTAASINDGGHVVRYNIETQTHEVWGGFYDALSLEWTDTLTHGFWDEGYIFCDERGVGQVGADFVEWHTELPRASDVTKHCLGHYIINIMQTTAHVMIFAFIGSSQKMLLQLDSGDVPTTHTPEYFDTCCILANGFFMVRTSRRLLMYRIQ